MKIESINTCIVIINGKAGVGKDTFVNYCKEFVNNNNLDVIVENLHRSDLPKKALKLVGWDGNKTFEARELLVKLTDFGENFGMTYDYLIDSLSVLEEDKIKLVFYHVRDPKSIEKLKNHLQRWRFNVWTMALLITRYAEDIEPDRWGIENYNYDFTLELNTLERSKASAEAFVTSIINTMNLLKGEK